MTEPTHTCQCGAELPLWMTYHRPERGESHYVVAEHPPRKGTESHGKERAKNGQLPASPDEPRVIVLPFDSLVSVNRRSGGMVGWTTTAYREARDAMAQRATVQASGWPKITAPCAVSLHFHPPNKRRRDLHNYPKAIMDALTHAGVWEDDSLVVQWSGVVHPVDKDDPRAVIEIRALSEQTEAA
jgi:Holliday junction resolvase RusA-like endonuclease